MSRTAHPKTVGRKPPREAPLFPRALCKAITQAYDEGDSPAQHRGALEGAASAGAAKRLKKAGSPWEDAT